MNLAILATKTRHGLAAGESVARRWFEDHCLLPDITHDYYDLTDGQIPNLPGGVTHVLILGQHAGALFLGAKFQGFFKTRGNLYTINNRQILMTFDPQEAYDIGRNYEDKDPEDSLTAADEKDDDYVRPLNYRAWMELDTKKLLSTPASFKHTAPGYFIRPDIKSAVNALKSCDRFITLDIETRREDWSLDCIGFACDDGPVYTVPIYTYKHALAYPRDEVLDFFAQLARTMASKTVICHNAFFDLWVLAYFYRIPFSVNLADTMAMTHRVYPELEKSLGAAIKLWTRLPYHKDEYRAPFSSGSERNLWLYNAKDVYGTREVYKELLRRASTDPGLQESISQVNASLYPYLLTSLQGVHVNTDTLHATQNAIKARIEVLIRMRNILFPDWAGGFNPKSSPQCAELIHNQLGVPIKHRKSKTRAPEMDEKTLYKILMNAEPKVAGLIRFIIHYRLTVKSLETVTFNPYPEIL